MNIIFMNSKGEAISNEYCFPARFPIPRKGEKVSAGSFTPEVHDIVYDYDRGLVMVVLDTGFPRSSHCEVKF